MIHPGEPQTIWFYYDEKNFCQDQKHNTKNNRWLAYSPKDTPGVRVGTWNLGSQSGKGRDVCEELRKGMVDVYCLQEVRSRTYAAMMKGTRYKLWWSGIANGVGRYGEEGAV